MWESGVESRRPNFRKLCWSWEDVEKEAYSYRRIGGVHHTVWQYVSTEYSPTHRLKPVYDTAIFNKVFVESDDDSMAEIIAMRDFFKKHKLHVKYYFSGRGFYALIDVRYMAGANKHNILYNVHDFFIRELDIDVHACIRGQFSQTRRMPNTLNPRRNRYCIWLRQDELDLGYNTIRAMALQKRDNPNGWANDNVWDVTKFDHEVAEPSVRMKLRGRIQIKDSAQDALDEYGLEIEDLCPLFRNLLASKKLGHEGRFWSILYMKDRILVPDASGARDLFYNFFDKEEFWRAAEECQFGDCYRQLKTGHWKYNFRCSTVKKMGYCPKECKEAKK